MRNLSLSILFCLLSGVQTAAAQTWTSPDGRVSVSEPEASVFRRVEPPPDSFLALWVNHDESIKLSVMKLDAPMKGMKAIRQDVIAGFGKQAGGQLKELPDSTTSKGYTIWHMQAATDMHLLQQAACFDRDVLYKLLTVTSLGADTEPAQKFIDSFSVTAPLADPALVPPQRPDNTQSFSKYFGIIGSIIVIIMLIYRFTRPKNS